MALTRRLFLGATVATLPLAGCTSSDDAPAGATDTDEDSTATDSDSGMDGETTTTDSGTNGATVSVSSHPDLGDILVDSEGMTLYMFDQDTQGDPASVCYDGCAEAWPPLLVEGEATAGDGVTAELTTFEREDGSTQVSANGWPLYYFQNDSEPGDATGQGANDVWWVLSPDGMPVKPGDGTSEEEPASATVSVSSHPDLGDILVGSEGMTLYMFDQDTQGDPASVCYDGCAEAWPPLLVEGEPTAGDGVSTELTTFEREDGSKQVAANGWPLYYFQNDSEAGDATGQGANDVWWVLRPDGTPHKPDQ